MDAFEDLKDIEKEYPDWKPKDCMDKYEDQSRDQVQISTSLGEGRLNPEALIHAEEARFCNSVIRKTVSDFLSSFANRAQRANSKPRGSDTIGYVLDLPQEHSPLLDAIEGGEG